MKTHTTTLTLAACLALTLGGLFSLQAQDATPRQRPPGGFGGRGLGGPGFDSLSQDEKDKLKAAFEKAQQDSKVKEAREKMEAASKDLREAVKAAELAADPSVEPILKKLEEAREKAGANGGGRRPAGDAPKQ